MTQPTAKDSTDEGATVSQPIGDGLATRQGRIRARSRTHQAIAAAAVIALGLLSRSGHVGLSRFWSKYSGDALWALMVMLLVGVLFPRRSLGWVAAVALAYSCVTEFSQLIHTPWLDRIRHNPFGRLVLGDTFAWADMIAYMAGIIVGVCIELAIARLRNEELP